MYFVPVSFTFYIQGVLKLKKKFRRQKVNVKKPFRLGFETGDFGMRVSRCHCANALGEDGLMFACCSDELNCTMNCYTAFSKNTRACEQTIQHRSLARTQTQYSLVHYDRADQYAAFDKLICDRRSPKECQQVSLTDIT